jgi:tetratricopeptide (TPR) repeat protein
MRRMLKGLCLLAAGTIAAPLAATAQGGTPAFAVLPFENGGSYGQDKGVFEALELGLPTLLAGALDRHPSADAIDPGRLAQATRSPSVGAGQRIDAATAAQIGKEAGARYVVTGSFADFYGKFRMNARVVDAQTGEILDVVSNDAKLQDRAQLSAIIQSLSEKIAAAAHLPGNPSSAAPVPTEAIIDYSRGLLLESRGDKAKARELYQKALTAAPGFADATAGLQRVS